MSPRPNSAGLRTLFGLGGRLSRSAYGGWGIGLLLLKFALDSVLVRLATGDWLTLSEFALPLFSARQRLEQLPLLPGLVLGAESLVFLWLALALSLRRTEDARLPASLALFVAVPVVNWVVIGVLLARPPAMAPPAPESAPEAARRERTRSTLWGLGTGTLVAVLAVGLATVVLGRYGLALFVGTPFFTGAAAAFVDNQGQERPWSRTLGVGGSTALVTCVALLLVGLEGAVCIAMALPLALLLALLGAAVGRHLGRRAATMAAVSPVLAGLGGLHLAETWSLAPPAERSVTTSLEIEASAEAVWDRVVEFPPLPPPEQALFKLGIAFPTRAHIEGPLAAGAVRHCEFSTGAFVEPITHVERPRWLAFDVRSQPAPLVELSPYGALDLPHLQQAMVAVRGEFRLEPLGAGRTRLTGTTWYRLGMAPVAYWSLWTDGIVHTIHRRVLEHIRRCAELA